MSSLSSPIIKAVRDPSGLQLIRWTLMKLAKQLFFFYGWADLSVWRGKKILEYSQGCWGLDFQLPISRHLSFSHSLSISAKQSICHHSQDATKAGMNLITCSCENWKREGKKWEVSCPTNQQTKTSDSSLIGLCILSSGLSVEGSFFLSLCLSLSFFFFYSSPLPK